MLSTAAISPEDCCTQLGLPWTPQVANRVRVLVLAGYGLNCDQETAAAFTLLGASVKVVHFGELFANPQGLLHAFDLVVIGGGFSFGDHIASGRVLANRVRSLAGVALLRFVDEGGFLLGVCNGFQTLVKSGLLPGDSDHLHNETELVQTASLISNERAGYRDSWVRLRVEQKSSCRFTELIPGSFIELPSRHGEGKLILSECLHDMNHRIPFRYVDELGEPTEKWPANPSGSSHGAASLCDETGRIFGLMPHPEAYIYAEQHPRFFASDRTQRYGQGLYLLAGGLLGVLDSKK